MPEDTREKAFNAANEAISHCNWTQALSVLMSLLATVITLGPGRTPEEADEFVDVVAAEVKKGIRSRWPDRVLLEKRLETTTH